MTSPKVGKRKEQSP